MANLEPFINVRRMKDNGEYEYLYRYEMTADKRYRVRAKYTGLKTGAVGSGGKSFLTEAERHAVTAQSCRLLDGWKGWSFVHVWDCNRRALEASV